MSPPGTAAMGKKVRIAEPDDDSILSRIRQTVLPCFFGSHPDEVSCNPKSVLFVCLGNICRSPIAEAVFRQVAKERGTLDSWVIDSAATADYHIGEPPDNRAVACLRRHGITSSHAVRQMVSEDFQNFAYILAMDHENLKNIKRHAPKNMVAKCELLGLYDPHHEMVIEDPYYGADTEFDSVYEQCLRACRAFMDHAEKELAKAKTRKR